MTGVTLLEGLKDGNEGKLLKWREKTFRNPLVLNLTGLSLAHAMFVTLPQNGNRALKLVFYVHKRETQIHRQPTQSFHHLLNDTSDSTMYSSHALHPLPIALETQTR